MNCRLSIIVPAYNAQGTLARCLNSIIPQMTDNVELIVVDDGSTDSTSAICDGFASSFKNLTAIHQSNNGVSSARNAGLAYAKGEWISFVDSDDELTSDALQKILDAIETGNQLIVMNVLMKNTAGNGFVVLPGHLGSLTDMYGAPLNGSVCNKVFLREIIKEKHLEFDESMRFYEDWLFVGKYCSYINGLTYIAEPCYIQYLPESYEGKYKNLRNFQHTLEFYSKLKPFNKDLSDMWVDSLVMKLLTESDGFKQIISNVSLLKMNVGIDINNAKGHRKVLIRKLEHTNCSALWNAVFYLYYVLKCF